MTGYAGTVVTSGDEVLLVFGDGVWTIPSGHIEAGESPEQAAIRELREEAGVAVPIDSLVPIVALRVLLDGAEASRSWNYTVDLADPVPPGPIDDDDITEARWFSRADAIETLAQLGYPPIREPVLHFLRTGERVARWTFHLPSIDAAWSEFSWTRP